MTPCLLTDGTTLEVTEAGDLVITVRLGSVTKAEHAPQALRTNLRWQGRITIDWGMPIAVSGNDGVTNR